MGLMALSLTEPPVNQHSWDLIHPATDAAQLLQFLSAPRASSDNKVNDFNQ